MSESATQDAIEAVARDSYGRLVAYMAARKTRFLKRTAEPAQYKASHFDRLGGFDLPSGNHRFDKFSSVGNLPLHLFGRESGRFLFELEREKEGHNSNSFWLTLRISIQRSMTALIVFGWRWL